MHVIINATQQKAFVNNVSIQAYAKVYTLSEPKTGEPIWNGDRRLFPESFVTEIPKPEKEGIKMKLEMDETVNIIDSEFANLKAIQHLDKKDFFL